MTIRRRRVTGKPGFNPSNLVPHAVANHALWVEIVISLPPNPIALFAHAGNRLSRHRWRGRLIGIATDCQDWTVRPRLAEIVSHEVLADEYILLPGWLRYFSRG
jgi:hypothetical protein